MHALEYKPQKLTEKVLSHLESVSGPEKATVSRMSNPVIKEKPSARKYSVPLSKADEVFRQSQSRSRTNSVHLSKRSQKGFEAAKK